MAEAVSGPTGLYTTVGGDWRGATEHQVFHDKVSLLLAEGWSCAGGQTREMHGGLHQAMFRAPAGAAAPSAGSESDVGVRNLQAALAESYVDTAALKAAVLERDAEIVGLKGQAAAKLEEKKKELLKRAEQTHGVLEACQSELRQIEAEAAAAAAAAS